MEAIGLQTHIWNNNLRSAFLLAGFPVLLLGMVYAITLGMVLGGYLPGGEAPLAAAFYDMLAASPLAMLVALVWFAIAYFANQAIIDAATGAHEVTRKQQPELYNLLENLCISRGLKTPSLRLIDSPELNAFATGLDEKQYSITLTTGIVQALDRDELEAVLAHELTHIISRDVRTMVIASVFAGIITLLAQIIYRSILWGGVGRDRRDGERRGGGGLLIIIALAAAAIGSVLAVVIRMALSRRREFVADAGSVELTKNPDAMIRALQKISGHSSLPAPASVQAMFIDHGEGTDMFATHPPISARIDALVRYAGGRFTEPALASVSMPAVPISSAPDPTGPWGEPSAPTPDSRPGPWG